MSADFDPYYKWLGIAPDEQPPHHYRLLGIRPFEEDSDAIENAADQRMAHLRTFGTSRYVDLSQRLLNEVATAKVCLLNPQKKADYDAKLHELLDRQSAGEDSSSQLKGLKELSELLAGESSHPMSQARRQSSSMPWSLLAGGAAAVLVLALVAWALLGRGSGRPAAGDGQLAKAESERPKAASNIQPPAVNPQPQSPNPQPPVTNPQSPIPASGSQQVRAEGGKPKAEVKAITPGPQQPLMSEKKVAEKRSVVAPPPKPEVKREPRAVAKVDATVQKTGAKLSSSSPPSPIPDSPPSRLPVPAESAQDEARRQAQDLYRDEYAKAKKPAERAALAGKILKQAQQPGNAPTDRYVLLCIAREMAIQADDSQRAFEAIDELAKSFEVDAISQKGEALAAVSKAARTLAAHKAICERALSLGWEALNLDQFALADTFSKLAYVEAGKVRDKELVQRSRSLAKEQQDTANVFAATACAFKTIKEKPDDPAANLAVGRYLCFTKGDWSAGLSHLSKSDDAKLRALAEDELKCTPRSNQPSAGEPSRKPIRYASAVRLADGWWELGEAGKDKERDHAFLHAGCWYRRALCCPDMTVWEPKVRERWEHARKIRQSSLAGMSPARTQEDELACAVVLAEDVHGGYAGFDEQHNVYVLRRAAAVRLRGTSIRFKAKTVAADNRSYGEIFFSLDDANWTPFGTWSPQSTTESQQKCGGWQTIPLPVLRDDNAASEIRIRFKYVSGGRGFIIERAEWFFR